MIEFLIKLYLAFVVINTVSALLYRYLLKRKLESGEIDEIIKYQTEAEDKFIEEIENSGKTQEEVDNIVDFIYNNIEVVQIMLIIIPLLNIITFIGLMRSISEVMGS